MRVVSFYRCFLAVVFIFFGPCRGYQEIYNFTQTDLDLTQDNSKVLVFFDVDETLITTKEFLAYCTKNIYSLDEMKAAPVLDRYHWKVVSESSETEIVDPAALDFIHALKQSGAKVLGLTNVLAGFLPDTGYVPEWRYSNLKKLNIEFCHDWGNYHFDDFSSYLGAYPVLYKGILCTNREKKSDIIDAFLDYTTSFNPSFFPTKIIFYDDQEHNCADVENYCRDSGIAHQVYFFKGAQLIRRNFHPQILLEQMEHLVKTGKWVSTKELLDHW